MSAHQTGPRSSPLVATHAPASVAAAAIVIGWLAVQLALPTLGLLGPRPAPFAWQMYSTLRALPEAWTVDADGERHEVNIQELFAVPRAEIDYVAALRAGLCGATDAEAILIRASSTGEVERIECDR
jgi:hypothetical protein